jgi:serine/threonine protein kinase
VFLIPSGLYSDLTVQQKNVLVNSCGQPFLTDFGLIAVGDGSTGHLSVPQGGTAQYQAPEFLFSISPDAQIDEWTVCDKTLKPELPPVKTTEGDVFAYGRLILAVRFAFIAVSHLNL